LCSNGGEQLTIFKLIEKMIKRGFLLVLSGLIGWVSTIAQPIEKIVIDNDIQLIHLQDSIFVHVTWHHLDELWPFSVKWIDYYQKWTSADD
jgi:hypothetical protein